MCENTQELIIVMYFGDKSYQMYLYILPFKRRVHHMLRQKLEQLEGGLLTIFWLTSHIHRSEYSMHPCHDSQDPNRSTHIVNKTYICISTVKRFEQNFKWLILLSKIYVCIYWSIYIDLVILRMSSQPPELEIWTTSGTCSAIWEAHAKSDLSLILRRNINLQCAK